MTHKYLPHRKYPWFCDKCGYGQYERLMHEGPTNADPDRNPSRSPVGSGNQTE